MIEPLYVRLPREGAGVSSFDLVLPGEYRAGLCIAEVDATEPALLGAEKPVVVEPDRTTRVELP